MAWNKLANSVRGTLTSSINDSVTAMGITLASGSASYPASIDADNPIYLTIHNAANFLVHEIVKVTEVSGANVVTMVRAQRGTSALSWSTGAIVSLNLHAQDVTDMRAFIDAAGNAALVNVVASGNISGVNITASGVVALAAGTVAAPALYMSTDTGTGRYRPAANQIAESISGVQRALLSSSGWDVTGTRLQVTQSGAAAQVNMYCYRDSTSLSTMQCFSARGTSETPASLQTGDAIGSILARPWQTGTTFGASGFLRFIATENHTATANGTEAIIYVCANGGTSVAIGLEIDQDRKFNIPGAFAHTGSTFGCLNTAPTTKKTITGDLSTYNETTFKSVLTALAAFGFITDSTTT